MCKTLYDNSALSAAEKIVIATKTQRSSLLYGIALWMALNIVLMVLIILNGDVEDLNNWIEIALWTSAIPALLSKRKWGIGFAIFTLTYTLSTSVEILIHYQVWLNTIRVAINIPLIIYLFKTLFAGKTR